VVSGQGGRVLGLRRWALLAACVVAAWATAASSASAKGIAAGGLDPSFGNGGKATVAFPAENSGGVGVKYTLPFQFTAGHLEMAPAPGGKIVVAGSTKIVRFLPSGKLDRGFGSGGSVAVARPPGLSFVLAAVAVDSQGRVLLAGSARPLPSSSTPDPLSSSVMVMRFAADGSVDRSFGHEGTLITDFGIKPPLIGTSRYIAAAVGVRSLVVDSQDRPILTGGSVSEIVHCYPNPEDSVSTAYVARLTDTGAPDPSFGEAGLRQIADLSSLSGASLLHSGTLFTVGSKRSCGNQVPKGSPAVVLTSFGSEGNLNPNFGFAGFRSIGYSSAPVATVAPSGKIVLLGAKTGKSQLVTRLLPSGAPDPSFGRIGRVQLVVPKGASFAAVAVDRRGRLLFAGRSSRRISKSAKNPLRRSTFWLGRMSPEGSIDRSFGRRGSVRTGFGGPSDSFATQATLDARGRIVVGGGISTPRLGTGGGYAIARYLPGG
jgi:uncharacterized delta-60 repeat protein